MLNLDEVRGDADFNITIVHCLYCGILMLQLGGQVSSAPCLQR